MHLQDSYVLMPVDKFGEAMMRGMGVDVSKKSKVCFLIADIVLYFESSWLYFFVYSVAHAGNAPTWPGSWCDA